MQNKRETIYHNGFISISAELGEDEEEVNDPALNRECVQCNKFNINKEEPMWMKSCKSCYIRKKGDDTGEDITDLKAFLQGEMRKCKMCGFDKIAVSEPEYKDKCVDCFKKYKSNLRMCQQCHQFNVPADKPVYIVRCGSCYAKSRSSIR